MSLQTRLAELATAVGADVKALEDRTIKFRTVHTWIIKGAVQAADPTIAFFVSLAAGQTAEIVKVRYKQSTSGSVSFRITKNDVDCGYGTVAVPLATAGNNNPLTTAVPVAVVEDDMLSLDILGITSSPQELIVTVVLEHTVA